MNNRFIKMGSLGGIITAICCFTPLLAWIMGAIGLSALINYVDFVLLPLLGIFMFVLCLGIYLRIREQQSPKRKKTS